MLDQKTIDIVKSTAPVLQEYGERLTQHMYQRMFSHNPEVAPFFNSSNQAGGEQQRALAGAICAYAANIDNLEVLGGAVELIAHKHASLQIKAEHYPIVGEHLLASIREVLGEAASDEVIHAWSEAYGFLAKILIGREQRIYADNKEKPGGWEGFRDFKLVRKEVESEVITSFYLKPADGGKLPAFLPGQYITVRVPMPNGQTTMRNYSLSDRPDRDWLRISIKKEVGPDTNTPNGYVSGILHEQMAVGATLEIGPPCGEFFLDVTETHQRPLVLLSAGVGITPVFSILQAALEAMPDREIVFIHGCLNESVQAFRQTLDTLAKQHARLRIHYRYSDPEDTGARYEGNCSTGFVDAELIESLVPNRNADYYFCGPRLFMVSIYHELLAWGIPGSQVHFEFFGPRQELEKRAG